MYSKIRFYFFVITCLFYFNQAAAWHIIGGEIYYEHISGTTYKITLKVYRDCSNPNGAQFDNPAHVAIYNSSGILVDSINIIFPGSSDIPSVINNPCLVVPPNLCVQYAIYTTTVNFNAIPAGGLTIVYQRCCRNSTILNIASPSDVGSTYITHIPDFSMVADNSSPYFNSLPPLVVCAGEPLIVNSSATDLNGDSLVYGLCTPYTGASSVAPQPDPAGPPPYTQVTFVSPYNVNNMMGGTPAMSIDPVTGILTAYPQDIGQFVIGISVKEYRNGILIGENKRDFQFNVVPCNPTVKAIFNPTTTNFPMGIDTLIICGALQVNFKNTSIGDQNRKWNFGDPATTNDTSLAKDPSYTYPDTGIYKVSLMVNPGSACSDTTYRFIVLRNGVKAHFIIPESCEKLPITFIDTSFAFDGTINSWHWEYGDGNVSPNQNPTHIFTIAGIHAVTLLVKSDLGCTDQITQEVIVNPTPQVFAGPDTTVCYRDSVKLYVNLGNNFFWSPAYELSATNIQSPIASPNVTTTYTASIINNFGCIGKDSAIINIVDTVIATVGPDTTICFGESVSLKSDAGIYYAWFPQNEFENNDLNPQVVTPTENSTYYVYSAIGSCYDFDSVTVNIMPLPNVQAIEAFTINQGESAQLTAIGAISYLWSPDINLSDNQISDPIANPLNTTTYFVEGTAANGCRAIDSTIVFVTHIHLLFVPNVFTPNADGLNDDFRFYYKGIRKIISVQVYNRFGQMVFESENESKFWQGYFKNREQGIGVYVYVIKAETYDGDILIEKGNLTLMR